MRKISFIKIADDVCTEGRDIVDSNLQPASSPSGPRHGASPLLSFIFALAPRAVSDDEEDEDEGKDVYGRATDVPGVAWRRVGR